MSIGTEIIKDALGEIGAHSVAAPANPEAIELGKRKLNSMCEIWLSKDIRFGFTPLSVPGDELNEPADVRNGIVSNLALLLAPSFDNGRQIVSPSLKSAASAGFREIQRLYQRVDVPDKGVSSTLPRGQGNKRRANEFFGRNATING